MVNEFVVFEILLMFSIYIPTRWDQHCVGDAILKWDSGPDAAR